MKKCLHIKRLLAMVLAAAITVTSVPATALAAPADIQTDAEQSAEESVQMPDRDEISDAESGAVSYAEPDEVEVSAASDTEDDTEPQEDAQYEFAFSDDLDDYTEAEYRQGEPLFIDDGSESAAPKQDILKRVQLYKDGEPVANLGMISNDIVKEVTYKWRNGSGSDLGAGESPKDAGAYTLVIMLPAKEGEYKAAEATVGFTITKAVVTVTPVDPTVKPGTVRTDVKLPEVTVSSSDSYDFIYDQTEEKRDINLSVADIKKADVIDPDESSLKDTDKFVKNQDYVMILSAAFAGDNAEKFAANYDLECKSAKIAVEDLLSTRVSLNVADSDKYSKVVAELPVNGSTVTIVTLPLSDTTTSDLTDLASAVRESAKVAEVRTETVRNEADGTEEEKEIEIPIKFDDDQLTGAWHAAVYSGWKEGDLYYCTLTEGGMLMDAPKGAGTYVYKVSYTGADEIYGPSYAYVIVEVGTVELIVRPKLSERKFYSGQTAADVLAAVEPEVLKADGTAFMIPDDLKDHFWGTAYDVRNATQFYEPVFEVVRTAKDGEETVFNPADPEYDGNAKLGPSEEGTTYAVRFTGQKAIYKSDGSIYAAKGINDDADSRDGSYIVKTDEDTLTAADNTVPFEVEGKDGMIDTDEIGGSDLTTKAGEELLAALKNTYKKIDEEYNGRVLAKVYDGQMMFGSRSDYKKAKLKDASIETDPLKDYTYTWYEWRGANNDPKKNGYFMTTEDALTADEEDQADGANKSVVKDTFLEDGYWNKRSYISPVNAGIYKLVISYTDPKGEIDAKDAVLYVVIERQGLTLTMNEKEYTEFSGICQDDFLSRIADTIEYGIAPAGDAPAKAEDWRNDDTPDREEEYQYTYKVDWKIQRQETDKKTGEPEKVDGVIQWTDLSDDEPLDVDHAYRIVPRDFSSCNDNYKAVFADDPEGKAVAAVKVEKMGRKKFRILDDDQKEWIPAERTMEYNGESLFKDEVIAGDIAGLNNLKLYIINTKGKVEMVGDEIPLTYIVAAAEEESADSELHVYEGRLPEDEADWAWAANSGIYTIGVTFRGDGTYAPIQEPVILEQVTITPRELKIHAPKLTVKAGTAGDDVVSQAVKAFFSHNVADVEGAASVDVERYFTKAPGADTYPAWQDEDSDNSGYAPDFVIYEGKKRLSAGGALTEVGNATYTLKITGGNLQGICARNYKVVPGDDMPITVIRHYSLLESTSGNIEYIDNSETAPAAADKVFPTDNGSYSHEFRFLEGIPCGYYKNVKGNWVEVRITAPEQYEPGNVLAHASYEQAIINAGGEIAYAGNGVIMALFNVPGREEDRKDAEFNIRWDDDYIEQFHLQFGKSVCLGDPQDAVAPKTLTFNTPKKTMVVGEVQQLDVKITKYQISDVVCLGYKVKSGQEEYLHVDEFGRVTALQEGKALEVTVYPLHLVNGVKEEIPGKSATVAITVAGVTAPRISKVTAQDTSVTIRYPFVGDGDGYRREIYVMQGPNLKADDFETAIASMKSGRIWQGIFAVAPQFVAPDMEKDECKDEYDNVNRAYDSKKKVWLDAVEYTVGGLKAGETYTVYVRNVSAFRTLADGCQVQVSHAGTAKSFTMTKPQIKELGLALQEGTYTGYDEESGIYTVDLTQGRTQLELTGFFEDLDSTADIDDRVAYPLPLKDPAAKQTYVAPKIVYSWKVGSSYNHSYRSTANTTLGSVVTIAKNGKATLKQPTLGTSYDTIEITAEDTTTGISAQLYLHINAEADAIKGKTTSLSAGESIVLERLVNYKQKSKTLNQDYYDVYGRIDSESIAEQLETSGKSDIFRLSQDGRKLVAYGSGSVTLKLTDRILKQTVKVTVKSANLASVKKLTVTNVIDNKATVQFERNAHANAYRIDVYDARKTLIRSVYSSSYLVNYESKEDYEGIYGLQDGWAYHYVGEGTKRKTYITYRFGGLTHQSKYTVKVTALYVGKSDGYDPVESGASSKAFKTTKLPVADRWLRKNATGVTIKRVYERRTKLNINVDNVFVSGNQYTLLAALDDAHIAAQYAATDKLTWTSSNKKVATVKANAGSYSATLKALKNGTTTIEVKSKILKQVVARYEVRVRAVGDAYSGRPYYGDDDLRDDDDLPYVLCKELTIGVPVAVEVPEGHTMDYRFTAPRAGYYKIYLRAADGTREEKAFGDSKKGGFLEENESTGVTCNSSDNDKTIWVELVEGNNATGRQNRIEIKLGDAKPAVYDQWFVFTAPEDGYYSFAEYMSYVWVYGIGEEEPKAQDHLYLLKKGDVVYLQARASVDIAPRQVQALNPGDEYEIADNNTIWFTFRAPEADIYEIGAADWPQSLSLEVYDKEFQDKEPIESLSDLAPASYMLAEGEEIFIEITKRISGKTTMTVVASKRLYDFGSVGSEGGEVKIADRQFKGNDYVYIAFTAAEEGNYLFKTVGAGEGGVSGYVGIGLQPDGTFESGPDGDQPTDIDSPSDMSVNITMVEGEQIWLKIRPKKDVSWNDVTVTAAKTDSAEADPNDPNDPNKSGDGEKEDDQPGDGEKGDDKSKDDNPEDGEREKEKI